MHGHGLGVLATGPAAAQPLRPLLQSGPTGAGIIRAAYARLGQGISLQYQLGFAQRRVEEALDSQARLRGELTSLAAAEQERLRSELAGQAAAAQEQLRAELTSQAAAEREKLWATWIDQVAASEERLTSQLAAQSADQLGNLASSVTHLVSQQEAAQVALRKLERTVRKRIAPPLGKRLLRTTKALPGAMRRVGRKLSKKVRRGVRALLRPGRTPPTRCNRHRRRSRRRGP